MGEYLHDMRPRKVFLNETQKALIIKQKIDTSDYTKITNFYSSDNSIKKPQSGRRYLQLIH